MTNSTSRVGFHCADADGANGPTIASAITAAIIRPHKAADMAVPPSGLIDLSVIFLRISLEHQHTAKRGVNGRGRLAGFGGIGDGRGYRRTPDAHRHLEPASPLDPRIRLLPQTAHPDAARVLAARALRAF